MKEEDRGKLEFEDSKTFDDGNKFVKIHSYTKETPYSIAYRKMQNSEDGKDFKGLVGQLCHLNHKI